MKKYICTVCDGFTTLKWAILKAALLREQLLKIFLKIGFVRFAV